ncbi:hypothetical protein Pfo_014884 [Paulownia fortunei]|nr:hypothetical protein Pfo_014884 [Paulownia fortunei]
MGRGKVVLETIENKVNRQVTFGKRKNGMIKKAQELSVLCDAEVAMIIFSNQGKLFDFGNRNLKYHIIKKYRFYSAIKQLLRDTGNYVPMWMEVMLMDREARHLLGEDLDTLSLRKLQSLEKKVEGSLSNARKWQTTKMLEQIEALRKTESDLEQENKQIKAKICKRFHYLHVEWKLILYLNFEF